MPKMLKASAILDTLVDGCENGAFVLRLTRPDGTFRTWWMARPDETSLNDPALELVLPEAAELSEVSPALLAPEHMPGLWAGDEIAAQAIATYFGGGSIVQVKRDGYAEPMQIPKAEQLVVDRAVSAAVENGILWLLSGPASILGEPIPVGVLNNSAKLRIPPAAIAAAEILPENLGDAWQLGVSTGLSIAAALSMKVGRTLPWLTVRDAITSSLQARFIELAEGSRDWPCDFPSAQFARFKVTGVGAGKGIQERQESYVAVANAELNSDQVVDLADIVPKLMQIKAKANVPMRFTVSIKVGDEKAAPTATVKKEIDALLEQIKEGFVLS
jgi:hypothetical protein